MAQSQQWFRPGGQPLLNNATQLNHFKQRIRDFAQALPGRLRALEAWRILQSAVAGKELDSVVAGKKLDSRIVAKVDFELRKLGAQKALLTKGFQRPSRRRIRCQVLPTFMLRRRKKRRRIG